jgi:ABC-type taurine transport system ATPase subunit
LRAVRGLGHTTGPDAEGRNESETSAICTSCQDGTTDQLGGALVLDQEILFLDELFAALDQSMRRR